MKQALSSKNGKKGKLKGKLHRKPRRLLYRQGITRAELVELLEQVDPNMVSNVFDQLTTPMPTVPAE
jgi:hypothetical protein